MCRLVQPTRPELQHLRATWFRPQEFIRKMRLAGLNIFPDVDSAKYVSTQSKVGVIALSLKLIISRPNGPSK